MQHRIKNATLKQHSLFSLKVLMCLLISFLLASCGGSGASSSSSNGLFSLSGKINPQRDSDIDLDLNAAVPLNNSTSDPQIIANPTTIGGYLSAISGAYTNGQLFNADSIDAYTVTLVEGQKIYFSVFSADDSLNDIEVDIKLKDSNDQEQLTETIDSFSAYTLTVPKDDNYTLILEAKNSSSPLLYTLTLSQSISRQSAFAYGLKELANELSQDFVPGEVLIRYKNEKSFQADNTRKTLLNVVSNNISKIENTFQLSLLNTVPEISSLYQFNSSLMHKAFSMSHSDPQYRVTLLEQKIQTLELIKNLQQHDDIEFAEPNFIYKAANIPNVPNDPRLEDQWNLSMVASEAAWQASTGQGIVVAVLDTGIDSSHEEWGSQVLADSYDFISNTVSAGDSNGFDSDPNDEGTSFHGSHVAGIIAATADNSKGIAGLAYDASIMALRVLGIQDTGSSSDIAQAILYAAGLNNTSGLTPIQRADIINMSFGSDAFSQTIKQAIDQAFSQGVILVAAAGNANTDTPFYPAAYEKVVGVGSVSSNKARSSFSNFGDNLSLMAPGGTGSGSSDFDGFQDAIISTINANNYSEYQGTSMAAPHVSAIAALMKELQPNLNGTNFRQAIEDGDITNAVTSSSNNSNALYGAGIINAAKAVQWAANSSSIIPATLSVYPTQFGFIGSNTSAQLSITNQGDGLINIISIDEQENWLIVTPTAVDSETGLGVYLVEVTPLLPVGQGEITINYQVNAGQIEQKKLNVFISSSNQSDSTVGTLSISIFKEEDVLNDNLTPFISVGGQLIDGAYHYCFNSVPSGRYVLSASTDNDKDQINFDKGEAVGSFPLLSRPGFIEIKGQNLSGIDFDIQYPAFSNSTINSIRSDAISTLRNSRDVINNSYHPFNIPLQASNFVSNSSCTN